MWVPHKQANPTTNHLNIKSRIPEEKKIKSKKISTQTETLRCRFDEFFNIFHQLSLNRPRAKKKIHKKKQADLNTRQEGRPFLSKSSWRQSGSNRSWKVTTTTTTTNKGKWWHIFQIDIFRLDNQSGETSRHQNGGYNTPVETGRLILLLLLFSIEKIKKEKKKKRRASPVT